MTRGNRKGGSSRDMGGEIGALTTTPQDQDWVMGDWVTKKKEEKNNLPHFRTQTKVAMVVGFVCITKDPVGGSRKDLRWTKNLGVVAVGVRVGDVTLKSFCKSKWVVCCYCCWFGKEKKHKMGLLLLLVMQKAQKGEEKNPNLGINNQEEQDGDLVKIWNWSKHAGIDLGAWLLFICSTVQLHYFIKL